MRFAGIEAGGTTFVVAIAEDTPDNIVSRFEVATNPTNPEITLAAVENFLDKETFDALGIASFGPVDLNPDSDMFGFITTTPKLGWASTSLFKRFEARYGVPTEMDTDVNGAAYSEVHTGTSGLRSCAYITVGTGIGAGVQTERGTIRNGLHPEAGHIQTRPHPADIESGFMGDCPYHPGQCCIEGMTKAAAIASRAGVHPADLKDLPDTHPVWDIAAYYLAQLTASLTLTTAVERVVLGGGVMNRACMYPKVRDHVKAIINGYVRYPALDDLDTFVAPSEFGSQAGIVGACALAAKAIQQS